MNKTVCPNIWMNNGAGDQIQLRDFLGFNNILENDPTSTENLDDMIERLMIFKEYGEYMKKEENIFCVLFMRHT